MKSRLHTILRLAAELKDIVEELYKAIDEYILEEKR